MLYTNRSLVLLWLIMSALFAVSVAGAPAGWWLVLLLAVALAAPVLVLKSSVRETAASPERPLVAAISRERSPLDPRGTDVLQWENEGGARRMRRLPA
jgi:uncharacterized protein (DUF58 family)